MFGFVRLDKRLLTPEERGFLNLAYCGLCHRLRERFGPLAGLALSRDMLLLVLLVATQKDSIHLLGNQTRCPAAGFLKRRVVLGDEAALDYACAMTMLLLDEKLADSQRDGKQIAGGVAHRAARPFIDRAYAILETFDFPTGTIREIRAQQAKVEAEGKPRDIAVHLDPTAAIIGHILAHTARIAGAPENEEPLCGLGQSIGSIVALADACEDVRTDRLRHTYNPFLDTASVDTGVPLPVSVLREACYAFACEFQKVRECLTGLNFARFPELVDNVISKGIPYRTKQSLYHLWVDNHWEGDIPEMMSLNDSFKRCPVCGKPHLPAHETPSRRASNTISESNHKNLWLLGTLLQDADKTISYLGFSDLKDYLTVCALSTLA